MNTEAAPRTDRAHDRSQDCYDLAFLDRGLAGTPFAGKLHLFDEIGSTNTYAMQQGEQGAEPGSVYLADTQTAGRGRGAHTWASPAGSGLYISILLRPAFASGEAAWCSLAAGLAVHSAVHATTGLKPDLRWPNDLLLGRRKFAGILTEMHAEPTHIRSLVIGIGVNVHQAAFAPELAQSATSLAMEGGPVSRTTLLIALLQRLHRELTLLSELEPREAHRDLLRRLEAGSTWIRGKRVIVHQGQAGSEDSLEGVTEGLDERGFLLVRTATGLHTVRSGGVREQEI